MQPQQNTTHDSNHLSSGASNISDELPQYGETLPPPPSIDSGELGQIFQENEYGEIKPAQSNVVRDPSVQRPVNEDFIENEHGEIHRVGTDPDRSSSSQNFGIDTPQKAREYRSDETYSENRYGELGRADTYVDDHSHLSDKVRGTAEQLFGKLTGNKELHDKGVIRKNSPPQ